MLFNILRSWSAGVGPAKDTFNIGDNPQFRLQVGDGKGAVWILLTRHIVDIEDFKYNREYITMLVYKNKGKRVYYPRKLIKNIYIYIITIYFFIVQLLNINVNFLMY